MNKHVPTILVVEDEKSLLKAWVEVFRKEGFDVLTASDEAGAFNSALRWQPDLLLVDLVMSVNLVKKLRETKWGQQVPVIFLSGWIGPDNSEKEDLAARDYYFHDHWDFEQIVSQVKDRIKLGALINN